jgi:hypothetical protein
MLNLFLLNSHQVDIDQHKKSQDVCLYLGKHPDKVEFRQHLQPVVPAALLLSGLGESLLDRYQSRLVTD